jgi:cell fate regulator YaaT (PSP1 superfamily)
MHAFNWGENIKNNNQKNIVVVRFKNNRKEIFDNHENLFLKKGDIVAVEAVSGHDIGIIDLTDSTAYWYALKKQIDTNSDLPKIYRKARSVDIEKWKNAISKEHKTLLRTKEIIAELSLDMKLGDVEFQGDGSKATFFYTADDRVDFRELIKILAQEFHIRIEMRQIGARQESARIGGIGPCGMELCCIRWKKNFESVTTNSARYQELSLNPSKLAGQCGKLKCCLNYEIDSYIEARKKFPDTSITLKTKQGNAYYQKSDVFKKTLWYSFDPENSVNITALSIERVNEIITMNNNNEIPDTLTQNKLELSDLISSKHNVKISSEEIIDSKDSPTNFKKKNTKKRKKRHNPNRRKQNNNHKKNNKDD